MTLSQRINQGLRQLPSWPLYPAGLLPGGIYFYLAVTNQLGPDPLAVLEHQLGELALQFLILTLAVTPLRKMTGISLLKFRRALGLTAFGYIVLHFLTWVVLDKQFFWAEILKDLYKRPYIVVGMTAFLLLIPLAATSNNSSIRRLGAVKWRQIHRLAYVATLLGAIHYLLLVKSWPPEPIIYILIIVVLLVLRLGTNRVTTFAAGKIGNRANPSSPES